MSAQKLTWNDAAWARANGWTVAKTAQHYDTTAEAVTRMLAEGDLQLAIAKAAAQAAQAQQQESAQLTLI